MKHHSLRKMLVLLNQVEQRSSCHYIYSVVAGTSKNHLSQKAESYAYYTFINKQQHLLLHMNMKNDCADIFFIHMQDGRWSIT